MLAAGIFLVVNTVSSCDVDEEVHCKNDGDSTSVPTVFIAQQ
jgi:hypothetical protein